MQELKNNAELRLRFENDLIAAYPNQKHPNLEKINTDEHGLKGRYKDQKVHNMWKGYQLFSLPAIQYLNRHQKKGGQFVVGRFIIGRILESTGQAQFSRTPFHHVNIHTAMNEMDRLVKTHNAPFALFRCVDVNTNVKTPEEFKREQAKIAIQLQIDKLQQELNSLN